MNQNRATIKFEITRYIAEKKNITVSNTVQPYGEVFWLLFVSVFEEVIFQFKQFLF